MYFLEDETSLHIDGDVMFDVYIKSPLISMRLNQNKRDKIKVSLKSLNLSSLSDPYNFNNAFEEINTTITILQGPIRDKHYQIKIEDVDITLNAFNPMLICSIELIPGDKPIGLFFEPGPVLSTIYSILNREEGILKNMINNILEKWNSSEDEKLQLISEFVNILKEPIQPS